LKRKKKRGFGLNDDVQGVNEPTNPQRKAPEPLPTFSLPNPFQFLLEAQAKQKGEQSLGLSVMGPNDDICGLEVYEPHTQIVERIPEQFSPPTQAPPKKKKRQKPKKNNDML